MPRFGPLEIGLILVIILIVFGVGKLPQVGQALGKSIREFNKARTEGEEGKKEEKKEAEAPAKEGEKKQS